MPELGSKPLSNTLMGPDQPDQKVYPKLHLDGGDASIIPVDTIVGTEMMMVTKVRVSSTEFAADGARAVTLEVLEAYPELDDESGMRMYPSMRRPQE